MARYFETTNRRLEQFFFVHCIEHLSWYKNQEGLTVWVYPATEEVFRVAAEFDEVQEKWRMKGAC